MIFQLNLRVRTTGGGFQPRNRQVFFDAEAFETVKREFWRKLADTIPDFPMVESIDLAGIQKSTQEAYAGYQRGFAAGYKHYTDSAAEAGVPAANAWLESVLITDAKCIREHGIRDGALYARTECCPEKW